MALSCHSSRYVEPEKSLAFQCLVTCHAGTVAYSTWPDGTKLSTADVTDVVGALRLCQ